MSGFSQHGLRRLHEVMRRHVDSGYLPGLVGLVSRHGEVHVEALGTVALGEDRPVRRDTIFRIASTTKPITAAAVLMLIEDCRVRLDDPLTELLPELAQASVLRDPAGPLDDVVPAQRPITTRDLLTFGCGYGFDFAHWQSPLMARMQELQVAPGPNPYQVDPEEWLRRLGSLPLGHQPGAGWMYNHGLDLAGIVVARVAGTSLGEFLAQRVFQPLGMVDTGFFVPEGKLDRLGPQYGPVPGKPQLAVTDEVRGRFSRPPVFEMGAGGLVSTADDLHAFHRMLLDGGRAGGRRLLSRSAVELMQTNQLSPAQGSPLGPDLGWAYGASVELRKTGVGSSAGRYGWTGGSGSAVYADPKEDSIDILLTQRLMGGPFLHPDMQDFCTAAYAAMEE
ncbi:MAG: serine hydrolase domain-containing protein [Candidatus Dormibacteraceae bacterium]